MVGKIQIKVEPMDDIMNKNPLVSVVVPNFNYASYLPERMDSILGQTYRNIEVILLDDCSTDESVELMREYMRKDARIKVLDVNKTNSGSPFQQWAKGIRMCNGKYVWIAEADDMAELDLLDKAVRILETNKPFIFVKVDSILINERGEKIEIDMDHWKRHKVKKGDVEYWKGDRFVRRKLYRWNNIYNASGVLFRRDSVEESMLASLTIPSVSDWLFWAEMAHKGNICILHERLNKFRRHSTSVSHTKQALVRSHYNEADVIIAIHQLVNVFFLKRWWRFYKILQHTKSTGDTIQEQWSLVKYIWAKNCSL